MRFIGIDYSMNSPAACCMESSGGWDVSGLSFFFLTGKQTKAFEYGNGLVKGELIKAYETDTERFLSNAAAFKRWIHPDEETIIAMEGYAFAAKGSRVFQIGEAGGILKTLLIHDMQGLLINDGKNLSVPSPNTIKKFATTKGNADKQMMYDAFVEDTSIDLLNTLAMAKLSNPVHDLSDAYWICKYGYESYKERNQ